MRRRRPRLGLDERLAALQEAIATAQDRVPTELLTEARTVLERSDERRARGDQAIVVALCGGTGTGKSSLFNALAGEDLAAVDVRRPTTDTATAWSIGDAGEMAPLLDWLEIDPVRRHLAPHGTEPDGLVLLDLPDMDSVAATNRTTADRLLDRVDVLIWVVDPHKYAQRSLHEGYLGRLREHAEIMLIVLNHVDRLATGERHTVTDDLRRLVGGGDGPGVIAVSAVTGVGLDRLRTFIRTEVTERRAVARRIAADVRAVAAGLLRELAPPDRRDELRSEATATTPTPVEPDGIDPARLTDGLVRLAGVDRFADQAQASYVVTARRTIRTPVLRLLGIVAGIIRSLLAGVGFLGRLALVQTANRDASPQPSNPTMAHLDVRHALLGLSEHARRRLPWFWADRISAAVDRAGSTLPARLKSALAGVPLTPPRRRWWRPTAMVWILAEIVAVIGIVWIFVLPLVMLWLQLPPVPVPTVRDDVSLPGAMIAISGAIWIVMAVLRRVAIRAGARRHRRAIGGRAREAVQREVQDTAIGPLQQELDAYRHTRERLELAAT